MLRQIAHGERVADIIAEAKALTFATGNEHALISLTSGQRVLVSGGRQGSTSVGCLCGISLATRTRTI